MQIKNSLLIIVCITYLLFTFSCEQNARNNGNSITFDTLQISRTHHQNNDPAQLACDLQISFVYPKSGTNETDLKNLQSIFIEKILSEAFSELPPKQALNAFTTQYIDDFNNLIEDEEEEDEGENDHHSHDDFDESESEAFESENEYEYEYLYYLAIESQIVYNKNNLVSFTVEKRIFEGGAHGSNSIYGYVINLNTGKLINEDFFAGINYSKNLSALMIQKLAKDNGLSNPQDLENIGYINLSDIAPNNNFTLDEKGITYYFNEYEIGAYFLGVTKIFIPHEELNVYISEESPIYPVTGL